MKKFATPAHVSPFEAIRRVRIDDHFVEITEMIEIGSGAQRAIRTVLMSCTEKQSPVRNREGR